MVPDDLEVESGRIGTNDPIAGMEYYLKCESRILLKIPELCSPSVLGMLEQARTELDPTKRLELAHQIELGLMRQYNVFPVFWEQEAAAFWPEVRGYVHFPSRRGSFRKFMHIWIDLNHGNDSGFAGQTTGVPGGI